MSELTYLSCPFSHDNPIIEVARWKISTQVAARMMGEDTPMIHNPLTASLLYQRINDDVPETWSFWEKVDLKYLAFSKELRVLRVNGWEESHGVGEEIKFAEANDIPVVGINPDEVGVPKDPTPGETEAKIVQMIQSMRAEFVGMFN